MLIEAGAEVDEPEEDGMTPLMNACKNGHGNVARLLCSKGASNDRFDRREAEEFTPLMHAALWGQVMPGRFRFAPMEMRESLSPLS